MFVVDLFSGDSRQSWTCSSRIGSLVGDVIDVQDYAIYVCGWCDVVGQTIAAGTGHVFSLL